MSEVCTGVFAKSVAGAPAVQTVTGIVGDDGVSFTPKVLILWTTGTCQSLDVWSDAWRFGFGFSVAPGDSGSISGAHEFNVGVFNASRRNANKALTIVQWSEVIDSECDLTSFGDGQFTITWTTNSANAYEIQYLALGGNDTEASIIRWQTNAGLGNQAVAGAGFQPETLIHLSIGGWPYPLTVQEARTSVGFVGKNGGQFCNGVWVRDSSVYRMCGRHQSNQGVSIMGIMAYQPASNYLPIALTHVSLDANGFTINVAKNDNAWTSQMFTLCMRGFESHVGNFTKSVAGAPAAQAVGGLSFQPTALVMSSWQHITGGSGYTALLGSAYNGIGGATIGDEHAQAIYSQYNSNPSNCGAYHASSKAFIKVNNAARAIDAECDLTSFVSGGFNLNWTTNDAVATQIGFLAFGELAPAPTPLEFTPSPIFANAPNAIVALADAHQSVDLNIGVFKPSINIGPPVVYKPEGYYIDTLDVYSDLKFNIHAVGGYWDAEFTLKGNMRQIEEWLDLGLNRHIVFWDHNQNVCWEGFVNEVAANVAGLTITRGPLSEIGNRVLVVYADLDTSVSPPTVGARTVTTIAQDTASQALYGIYDRAIDGGELDNGAGILEADQLRDTFVLENALPATTKEWSVDTSKEPSVTIRCLGYAHKLNYYYESDQNLTVTCEAKIGYILDGDPLDVASIGDPNNLFSAATSSISASGVLISRYEQDYSLAWDLLLDAVARGGGTNERWLLGVYANRNLIYAAAPITLAYEQNVYDAHQRITTPDGTLVRPWNVLPGRWLLFTDLLIGKTVPATLREDPRAMFIESVEFEAPMSITLIGGKVGTLSQWLSQRGLGTSGA